MKERERLRAQRKSKELAEEHWEWIESWLHLIFVDAFAHGYKHGWEDKELKDG